VGEINFGRAMVFGSEDILDLSLSAEGDPGGRRFPLSELNLTIANKGRFDQLDPDSMAQYLHKRQAFEYKHGADAGSGIQWVFCGSYYLENWRVDDDAVRFRALGKLSLLEGAVFEGASFEKKPLGEWIKAVLAEAGLSGSVPAVLSQSPPVCGCLGRVTFRAALTYLAEAAGCLVYEDKHNAVRFADVCGEPRGAAEISYGDMLKLPQARMESYYNGVNLAEYVHAARYAEVARAEFELSGERDVVIPFCAPVRGVPDIAAEGCAIISKTVKTALARLKISGSGKGTITIAGDAVETSRKTTFYPAPWKDPLEAVCALDVDLPVMIDDGNADFRNWFLERKFRIMRKRLSCGVTWRQDANIAPGEWVETQISRNRSVPLMSCEDVMEFSGGVLRGTTKLFGGSADGF
jgi:hypothetical protein